jgi:endonuclease/exonuclease/phosphatase family metal-dependent hydrolase
MTRLLGRVAAGLLLLLPLTVTASGTAGAAPPRDRVLTVMTQNLYLGSDLTPALVAQDPIEFLGAVATIFGTVLYTDAPTRLAAVADEIDTQRPDLIGLQEVSNWTVFGDTNAPSLDFLAILLAELDERGLNYDVAAVSNNASIGPAPLVQPCNGPLFTCAVLFQDRDVILVNADKAGLSVGSPRSGRFVAQQVLATPVGPLSFDRGWASVDGTFTGQSFRFAVTHLETEDFPAVQQAQGVEFLAVTKTRGAVVAVGDFNSAADGSTTTTYGSLTADYFRDAWWSGSGPSMTCCQNNTLTNAVSELDSRIDLVLTHAMYPLSATVVGNTPFQGTPPLWAADHAGVVAKLRLH